MSDTGVQLVEGWTAFKYLWGLVLSGLAWLGIRQVARIDALEKSQVDREDHQSDLSLIREDHQRTVTRLEETMRDMRAETSASFTRVFTRLDEIADRINERQ